MNGLRFIWRCTQVIDDAVLVFKEFIDDGGSYEEIRSGADRGWWTGEERRIPRARFWGAQSERSNR